MNLNIAGTEDFMSYFPVLLDMSGKKAVVLGGGTVARRKIETLLECGAIVQVISKSLTHELQNLLERGEITHLATEFEERFITDAFVLIIATDDRDLNGRVSKIAKERNILVNTVDQPEECTFIVPSVIRRGDLIIAVSTSGKSPALAKKIRESLEELFGKEYGYFLNMMGRIRKDLLSSGISERDRSGIFHNLVDSSILDYMRTRDMTAVKAELEKMLNISISLDEVRQYMKDE
jgi:precorrin-2 dehydrogenase / sirohydrochlorin ferrochelatase